MSLSPAVPSAGGPLVGGDENPLNERCDASWARLRAADEEITASITQTSESISREGETKTVREEWVIRRLGERLVVRSLAAKSVAVFGPEGWLLADETESGEFVSAARIHKVADPRLLATGEYADLADEDQSYYFEYCQGMGTLQMPYWPVSIDGRMERCFPEGTRWTEPAETEFGGVRAWIFEFESPVGGFFRLPSRGRAIVDRDHDCRWLLLEYDELQEGTPRARSRYAFDYAAADSREYTVVIETTSFADGPPQLRSRRTYAVRKVPGAVDPAEFTLARYGIVLADVPRSPARWWSVWILVGIFCLLVALGAGLRRRWTE